MNTDTSSPQITAPPPAPFLPGAAALVDCVDKRLLVTLRDGRQLVGTLRTYDQFANLVLQATVERIFLPSNGGGKDYRNSTRSSPTSSSSYADLYLGMFVIRGENVVLLGEIDEEQEKAYLATLAKVDPKQARDQVKREREERRERETARLKALHQQGFSVDVVEGDTY